MGLLSVTVSVPALCRQAGKWLCLEEHGFHYAIVNNDERPRRTIISRGAPQFSSFQFTARLSVRFSLKDEPRGLFAKILLRNSGLVYSAWNMAIEGSCEAQLYLFANVPPRAMDVAVFHAICSEMYAEISSVEQELKDRLFYEVGRPIRPGTAIQRPL